MIFLSGRIKSMLLLGATALTLLTLVALWSGMKQQDTTIEIRASHQGYSIPDGFYVWHHLDANGISFKSITPQNNNLLITFATSAQGRAAKEVLNRAFPRGYVIDQREDESEPVTWLSLMRTNHKHA